MSNDAQQRIQRAADLDLTANLETRQGRYQFSCPNDRMKRLLVSQAPTPWWRRALQRVRLWIATH